MLSDELYELCEPILNDESLEDEEKTERIEELLRKESTCTGKQLENSVLDALWRHRTGNSRVSSPAPTRHTVIRRQSPAPWQLARTPTPSQSSPRAIGPPPGLGTASPAFQRTKSSTASPFTSPRASPRLALSTPHIPHSPRLDAYQFSDTSPNLNSYEDINGDNVDWLVNDETGSNSSYSTADASLNGGAAEWMQPQTMDPYDMLRSIMKDDRSNEEIEKALEENGYDLSATIIALMDAQGYNIPSQPVTISDADRTILVGKSMSPSFRPSTPLGQQKSNILCKYYLANGSCARADCRFSHDASKTVCKYWMSGNCLAGESCIFSHDPSNLMARMMLEGAATPPLQHVQPNFQVQDYENFPSLHTRLQHQQGGSLSYFPMTGADWNTFEQQNGAFANMAPPPGFNPIMPTALNPLASYTPSNSSRPVSRPASRHTSRAPTPSIPAVDDNEAFPSLGSAAAVKAGKKHHGKRGGHGHAHKESPSSLAELVRMSPSPGPVQLRKDFQKTRGFNRENGAASLAIPAPENIPWLTTGDSANKSYLKARGEAIKHGGLRNKFLQSAAQAYNRNDSRAAKALSLRGQSENNLMREAHREAARILYEERNKDAISDAREIYIDLHGLHPEEAVAYLTKVLREHENRNPPRPIYAITGTGHHSKNGKDKIGKAIRTFLAEWRYAFREFSVPGDRGNMGGIVGIDPTSWDRSLEKEREEFMNGAEAYIPHEKGTEGEGRLRFS
ncbi:hypothetical protein EJ08DRAFT_684816 [Tothia fuscella]|uniref:Uncharacterized protein n=1 Tax=Tothia fuscella TaxID=1048955 RepID=A0A9P4P3E3_9PEZI|nr:hypothetical protein EJ08DRAFT_684816 [Tothia fuscella]